MNDNIHQPSAEEQEMLRQINEEFQRAGQRMQDMRRQNEEIISQREQLQAQNEQMRQMHAETRATLEAEQVARAKQQESHMKTLSDVLARLKRIPLAVILAVLAGLVGWMVMSNLRVPYQDSDSIKNAVKEANEPIQNVLAGVDRKLNDFDKRLGFAELQTKGVDDRLRQIVQDNVVKSEKADKTTTTTTTTDSSELDSWDSLNATNRAKLFVSSCSKEFALDGDRYKAFYTGVGLTSLDEARAKVDACDVDFFVQKGQRGATASNTSSNPDPNADEDAAAQQLTATPAVARTNDRVGGNTRQAYYPSPFVQPGYGRPPAMAGRRGGPRCPVGMFWSPERNCCRTQERAIPLNAYQQGVLANCPTRIESRWIQRGSRMVQQQRCAPSL